MALSNIIEYNKQINESFNKISCDILQNLGFTNFIYVKFLEGNRRVFLSSKLDWLECYVEKKLYNDVTHEQKVVRSTGAGYTCALWDSYQCDKVFKAANSFGLWHGFYVFRENELFSFISDQEKRAPAHAALHSTNFIHHFLLYFKNSSDKFISEVECNDDLLIKSRVQCEQISKNFDELFHMIPLPKKIKITVNGQSYHISKREAQILTIVGEGNLSAEIGHRLNISSRTVEKFVSSLRYKLNCISKNQLINAYQNSELLGLNSENFKF